MYVKRHLKQTNGWFARRRLTVFTVCSRLYRPPQADPRWPSHEPCVDTLQKSVGYTSVHCDRGPRESVRVCVSQQQYWKYCTVRWQLQQGSLPGAKSFYGARIAHLLSCPATERLEIIAIAFASDHGCKQRALGLSHGGTWIYCGNWSNINHKSVFKG